MVRDEPIHCSSYHRDTCTGTRAHTHIHTQSRPCFDTHSPPLKHCFTGHICVPRYHATVVIICAHDILLSQFTRVWEKGISNSIEHISRLIMAVVSIYSSADSQCCGERSNFTDGTVDHVGELLRLGQGIFCCVNLCAAHTYYGRIHSNICVLQISLNGRFLGRIKVTSCVEGFTAATRVIIRQE